MSGWSLSGLARLRPKPASTDEANALARELACAKVQIANLQAENAHLKRALALADALRNKERNLPL